MFMETPPFAMTSFQSAYGQVVAWCKYSSSETDGGIDQHRLSQFLLETSPKCSLGSASVISTKNFPGLVHKGSLLSESPFSTTESKYFFPSGPAPYLV